MTANKEKQRSHIQKKAQNGKNAAPGMEENFAEQEPLSPQQQKIAKWLKKVRFQKCIIGGVSETDVWKKISELNTMYEVALAVERERCDALITEHAAGEKAGNG